ncbi:hypothetical protein Msil_3706 [Methylocella silvestris BL2]|uniref:Uncharacterized protein n=2 Tax=Methylocella silvestris TaxID=199596 RepID=B8EJ98_METSB|nr:hypothetical protein Msil_3706 [Methylocella silvestris BL2]
MILAAPRRYGAYYAVALDVSAFLSVAVKSLDREHEIFGRFLSQVKNHHLLAIFAIVRLHQTQAMMNLRQVLEAGACAAFAIANPHQDHFAKPAPGGTLDASQELTAKRYKWLDENFPKESSYIKATKEKINSSAAHANIVYTQKNFRVADNGSEFIVPFFDIEDGYFEQGELLMAAGIAISLIDLFYGVNNDINAIVWCDDFESRFRSLFERETALRLEMYSSDRFKEQQRKFGHLFSP